MITDIKVTDEILEKARQIANGRVGAKSQRTLERYKWVNEKHDAFYSHFNGAIGELCFSIAYYGEMRIDENFHPDGDTEDFISQTGQRVDIKTSTFLGQDVHLKVEERELKKEKDIYVLVQYNWQRQRCFLIGWATLAEVLNGTIRSYGEYQHKNYTLDRSQLRSFK